jgi:hypothetical protein
MKSVTPLKKTLTEEEKQFEEKAKIIKFPEIHRIKKSARPRNKKVKITGHFLYYRDKKIPISQFEKAGYGKLLRLLVKEIS